MKKRILIVEDDEFNCLVYKMVLKKLDVEIEFATDGQAGVDKYLQNIYDLILLDMGLPLIPGYDVAKIMRFAERTDPSRTRTPIIAVSANNSSEMQLKAFDSGVDEFMMKPINGQGFVDLVSGYLNKAHRLLQTIPNKN